MERAAARLAAEQAEAGETILFARLRSFLNEPPGPGDYERAARDLNLDRGRIAALVHRLGRRYRDLVRAEAAETLVDRSTVDAELRHLLLALQK